MFSSLGRAVGSVIAGQLVTNAGLTIPETFNSVGIASVVAGTACLIFYKLVMIPI